MDVEAIAAFGRDSGIYGFMNSKWGWPTVESVHFLSLSVLLGTVGVFDLRALGAVRHIPIASLHRLIPFGVAAFCVNIVTGLMFFVSAPDQYAFNPAFQLKMACIGLAGINVVVFYAALAKGLGDTVSAGVKAIAAISLLAWTGVIVFGRLITYFRPPYHWCFWC